MAVQRRVENCSSVVGDKTQAGWAGTGPGGGRTMSGRGTKFWIKGLRLHQASGSMGSVQ